MTWQILDSDYEQAKITVLGIGGGGGNSVSHMIKSGIKGVNFICANTDAQDLSKIHSAKKIILGQELTQGLGAGNDSPLSICEARADVTSGGRCPNINVVILFTKSVLLLPSASVSVVPSPLVM